MHEMPRFFSRSMYEKLAGFLLSVGLSIYLSVHLLLRVYLSVDRLSGN